ncbi:hypothetical protein FIV42_23060 [Persicimonas caeni]|uniref:Uncharacterized protein n=2 Tax=Persicimonas caeni TaxID=2292766 RepID=A0A4Y6Q4N6_PERCE|nr:hypothetical protein FIV42_23060 [Persicimonas caeni]QED36167.1 hypothetical protein FRD00_23055 [Persicimonas caeni]
MTTKLWLIACAGFLLSGLSACQTEVYDTSTAFVCQTTADCAPGYECKPSPQTNNRVCRPVGASSADVGGDVEEDVEADAAPQCEDGTRPTTYFRDADEDGWGTTDNSTLACDRPQGFTPDGGDCNDAAAWINPDAEETCNGFDDDCDGSVDASADFAGCPSVQWTKLPGILDSIDMTHDANGELYMTASFTGRVELGDVVVERQASNTVIARMGDDGSVQWVQPVISVENQGVSRIAVNDDYVVVGIDVDAAVTVDETEVPLGDPEQWGQEVVLLVLSKTDGQLVSYRRLWAYTDFEVKDLAFDSEGDLWAVVNPDLQFGGYAAGETLEINDDGLVLLEFGLAADGTIEDGSAWLRRIDAQKMLNGVHLSLAGTKGFAVANLGFDESLVFDFHTTGAARGPGHAEQNVEGVLLERIAVDQAGDLRLCGTLVAATTLDGITYAPEGISDVVLAQIDVDGATLLPPSLRHFKNPLDEACKEYVLRDSGAELILADVTGPGDETLTFASATAHLQESRGNALLINPGQTGASWVYNLTASFYMYPESLVWLPDGRVVAAAGFTGALPFADETTDNTVGSFVVGIDAP